MKKNAIDQVVELWMNNDSFRAEFSINPRAAADRRGIELDEQALDVVAKLPGIYPLEARINMCQPTNAC
jgi:hypothetical protein